MKKSVKIPIPPSYWIRSSELEKSSADGLGHEEIWENKFSNLRVARTISVTGKGVHWLHVSVSRKIRPPSWAELTKVKIEFIGNDREAYQVFGSAMDHFGAHDFCMHLWWPLDGVSRIPNLSELERDFIP